MSRLTGEREDYLRSLPLLIEWGDFTMAHGSPRDPVWEYVATPAIALANSAYFITKRCLVGHTHAPFICTLEHDAAKFLAWPEDRPIDIGDARLIINPGSVGQPRDGLPSASFAIYDDDEQTIARYRVAYDVAATQRRMRAFNLPRFLIDRLAMGR